MDLPSFLSKHSDTSIIPATIVCNLFLPELNVGFRLRKPKTTVMTVPIAAMHKDNFSLAGKHKVGASRKVSSVQPIAIAERVQGPAHSQLWPRIL